MQSATAIPSRFLSILDFDDDTLTACLDRARRYKACPRRRDVPHDRPLEGLHVALLFEKPSLRTRSTFRDRRARTGRRRHRAAAPTSRWAGASRSPTSRAISSDGCSPPSCAPMRRIGLAEFAAAAPRLRVVNALTNEEHPCQALADCLTLRGSLGDAARPHDRVRRRWQQRRDLARAGGGDARRARPDRVAARLRAAGRTSSQGVARIAASGGSLELRDRSGRRRCAAPTRFIPTCGRRWARRTKPHGRLVGVRPLPGERGADVAGPA